MRGRGFAWSLVCCGAVALFIGCGADNPLGRKPLHGEVKLDGVPLDKAMIEFHPLVPGGVQSGGPIMAGKYSIPAHEGATPGEYRVVIYDTYETPPLPPGHMPGDDLPPPPKLKVPASWNSKSKQKVQVEPKGPFEFNFEIDSKQKAPKKA